MVQEILQKCTVEGTVVKLPPGQLDRKIYMEVAKKLELIGGKWVGRKTMGFVFQTDPTDLLEQIANGENRNLKKEYQYFATSEGLAKEMARYLNVKDAHQRILEPSAGQGALMQAVWGTYSFVRQINYCELMDVNRTVLEKLPGGLHIADDFLTLGPEYDNYFDCIIANPPFSKNQDIDHIRKMWDVLRPGGRIVTISSQSWRRGSQKKQKEFERWLFDDLEASVNGIDAGAFSESGTKVATFLVIIDKPKA